MKLRCCCIYTLFNKFKYFVVVVGVVVVFIIIIIFFSLKKKISYFLFNVIKAIKFVIVGVNYKNVVVVVVVVVRHS